MYNFFIKILAYTLHLVDILHRCHHRFQSRCIKKKRFLYFDWPFGGYIFDSMINAQYKNITLIKFSLFDIFHTPNRNDLILLFKSNEEGFKSVIVNTIKKIQPDALLVTHDWLPFHIEIINIFKSQRVPIITILHEGVFQDAKKYYGGKIPQSTKVVVWGKLHKRIFVQRGYPEQNIYVVGSIKLNQYKTFQASISQEAFISTCGFDLERKTLMYCCQLCDNQWGSRKSALSQQRRLIDDIHKIASKHGYNLLIRQSPSKPMLVLPYDFLEKYKQYENVFIDGTDVGASGVSTYQMKAEDSLYYSDLIIGLNTTMQFEASLLNKPAIVAHYFGFDPKWHTELGLPIASNYEELEHLVVTYIYYQHNLVSSDKKTKAYKDYGFSEDQAYSPLANIEKVLRKR